MNKESKWYRIGFNDGADNMNADPPYERGNSHYAQYMEGFHDGQRAESRGPWDTTSETPQ